MTRTNRSIKAAILVNALNVFRRAEVASEFRNVRITDWRAVWAALKQWFPKEFISVTVHVCMHVCVSI